MKIAVELVYKNVIDLEGWDEDWLEQFKGIKDPNERLLHMLEDIGSTIADDHRDYSDLFDLEIRVWSVQKGWLGAYGFEPGWQHGI